MKWVHQYVYVNPEHINEKLDYYSTVGWELVAVVSINVGFGLFFKRQKKHI